MAHEVAVYDIFLRRHTLKIYSLALRTVKCHPKYNIVQEVLSYILDDRQSGLERLQRLLLLTRRPVLTSAITP